MQKSIDTIRFLGVDMVNQANSGHPGIVLGAAPVMYHLFTKHLNVFPSKPEWFNRDRFVLSAGHGSALLYATLHLAGFDLPLSDLKNFRQLNSKTPGHPEYRHTEGVEATTGPLGQGISNAVGMAVAEKYLRHHFNKDDLSVVDHYTYVLCGDGDLQEGVTLEALSLAGHLQLERLIVLFDSNDVQLDGPTKSAVSENIQLKMQSMHWNYLLVEDANDLDQLNAALLQAKASQLPTFIEVKSIIGFGSKNQGTSDTHGAPIGKDETELMRQRFAYNYPPFDIPKDVYKDFKTNVSDRNKPLYDAWEQTLKAYKKAYPSDYQQLMNIIDGTLSIDFDDVLPPVEINTVEATRNTIGKLIPKLSKHIDSMIGGSADLSGSTKVKGINGDFTKSSPTGRNINYGVREHAMAAMTNGLTLHGLKAFSGGFFIFSDYMKPSIRLAALMEIPSIFIFTHDSVAVGEDGPTHEPIEQLSMFRTTPNIHTFRPAHANEVRHAIRFALESSRTPSVIALTRQNVTVTNDVSYELFSKGAYIVKDFDHIDGIIIATGSEVELALNTQKLLAEKQTYVRVVSMPCMSLFKAQPQSYKDSVLPPHIKKRLAVELGTPDLWYQFAPHVFGLESFGMSAPGDEVLTHFGFTPDVLAKTYLEIK
ncbi:MAG: transketolase [Acholeplasmataceae bacterium]